MRHHLLNATTAALLLTALASGAQAQSTASTAACVPADAAQISALFDRWNNSLRTGDPEQVVVNYAPDGVLLPTLSNQPRTNRAEMRDYFVRFLKAGPQGKIDQRIVKIGCNVAQDVGTYTFTFNDGAKVQARYTYVYEWTGGQWLIAHHHSSVMPETAPAH